jgi:hypothetical protein
VRGGCGAHEILFLDQVVRVLLAVAEVVHALIVAAAVVAHDCGGYAWKVRSGLSRRK